MPSTAIFHTQTFLFLYYILFSVIPVTTTIFSILYSSFKQENNNNNRSNSTIYNIKRDFPYYGRKGTLWHDFVEFLETHYEFTFRHAVEWMVKKRGVNFNIATLRMYLSWATTAGWVEVRARVKRGRSRIAIYRSLLYFPQSGESKGDNR